ncbi:extracellular solute-binding protein [Tessaracoccus caeni]|uniref:extracellular solute-binding protein n=1 Tax=Tessaracoccus caeni TaxID=3031239 RepID=UPI0023DA5EB0|nr:extracellular solute-binding protein [Tessaracoccus caeni]MDF1488975.1 extracellular solute-binding protein [Tessaracoccus caeni]
MKKKLAAVAMFAASAMALSACGGSGEPAAPPTDTTPATGESTPAGEATAQDITFWLIGGDTPQPLRDYLISEYKEVNGGALTIEEQTWGDIISKLTTSMPDAANTPDVTEIGNTQSPTFTNVGAFADISDMYQELGGDKLLQSFVEVGAVEGKNFTLPYYFGSRYMFYRKDVWQEAGVEVPKTLDEFNAAVKTITEKNPRNISDFSGFFLGGQDWRNGISWVFANGGDLAKFENGAWVSTLSDPNTIKGLEQLQDIQKNASMAPSTARDTSPWLYINDSDAAKDAEGNVEAETSLAAATIMAPNWAHWSIGDLVKNDAGEDAREWNADKFGTFVLPGNDGNPAPVFAGGSNLGISAASQNQEGARDLLRIIFSAEYQTMLGENGLGPANSDYVTALGDDEFAQAQIASSSNSKLTPAAPGWAAVEASMALEEFFAKVADGGDIAALAAEYDAKLTPMLNGS